jgi:hypothetical protein
MGIASFIKSKSKNTAVYFGTPVNDGRGKYTFSVVEEISVRWEDETENFAKDSRSRIQIGKDGKEFRPNSTVYTSNVPTGGWNLDGYLYLGSLGDLSSATDPYSIEGAYEIKQINVTSSLNTVSEKLYKILL